MFFLFEYYTIYINLRKNKRRNTVIIMISKNELKQEKAITLIALMLSLIILVILAYVSIRVAYQGNLIGFTAESAKEIQNAGNNDARKQDQLGRDIEKENLGRPEIEYKDRTLKISFETPVFETSSELPIVLRVTTKSDGSVTNEEIFYHVIDKAGKSSLSLSVLAEEGAAVEIKSLYSGANYNIDKSIQTINVTDADEYQADFTLTYNNKIVNMKYASNNF